LKVLQRDLGLSDSQASQVKELVEARRARLDAVRQQAKPAFEELLRLMRQPNPNTEAVGKAALAFKKIHEQAMAEQEKSEEEFLSLLNPQQQQTVNGLQSKAPLVLALHRLRLLGPERQNEQASAH
jgi:Spy/CpxP family protein refolding chaperone